MAAGMDNKKGIEIGVIEECDSYLLESRYFPNKLGGKPAWLDFKDLPANLICGVCEKPCIFLCQIYAPIEENPKCHHRSLFVFVCPNPVCCKINDNANFKVFRCQLPAVNDFYPVEDPTEEEDWHPECKVENFSKVCSLCGNPAPFNCGKCRAVSYCSKEHQIAHWKLYGHKLACEGNGDKNEVQIEVPFLFKEFEITIDKPPEQEVTMKTEEELLSEYKDMVEDGKGGTLAGVPEDLLEQYAIKEDKFFNKYKRIINDCPEQVVRYDRGGTPLYIAKPIFDESNIPKCNYCGGDRQFEFQILSTMLNEIGGADAANGLDWGTLLIYTCKQNCSLGPSYKEELILKQDIVE